MYIIKCCVYMHICVYIYMEIYIHIPKYVCPYLYASNRYVYTVIKGLCILSKRCVCVYTYNICIINQIDVSYLYNYQINVDMGVSKNRGTPKSSISIGFSIINHPFWGSPIFGNTICTYNLHLLHAYVHICPLNCLPCQLQSSHSCS